MDETSSLSSEFCFSNIWVFCGFSLEAEPWARLSLENWMRYSDWWKPTTLEWDLRRPWLLDQEPARRQIWCWDWELARGLCGMGSPGLVIRMSEAVVEAVLLRISGDSGLVRPSDDLLEDDGVDLWDCSVLDFKWSRSTKEEQEFSSTSFLVAAGFGGDFEVTTWNFTWKN